MKILKNIKKIPFVPPKKRYYLGNIHYGCPYFYPRNFNNSIITFRKLIETPQEVLDKLNNDYQREARKFINKPLVYTKTSWVFKILGTYYYLSLGFPIYVAWHGLGWKDKFDSPRFEWSPAFYIFFFNWQFAIHWNSPDGDNDKYYEMILWYLYYSDKDIYKAEKTWGWVDVNTKESTWNKNYIK